MSASVCIFRDELDSDKAQFIFWDVVAEVFKSSLDVVSLAVEEIVVDFVNLVFVNLFFDEVVDIEFCSTVNDGLDVLDELVKLNAFWLSNVVKRLL